MAVSTREQRQQAWATETDGGLSKFVVEAIAMDEILWGEVWEPGEKGESWEHLAS